MTPYLQKPKYDCPSTWRPPDLASLPTWPERGRVAVDVETCDPQLNDLGPGVRRGGFVCGVSLAIEDGPSAYLPVAHQGGDNVDPDVAWRYLRDQASSFKGTIVGMNLPYDLDYLAHNGVVFRQAEWFRDVSVAAVLINELLSGYSLDHILRRAGLPPKDEAGLIEAARAWGLHPKKELWRLPARHVGPYAIGDVELPLALLRRQEREIEKQGLERVWDLESRVLPVTVKIRRRGVRIDQDRLDQICRWALGQEQEFLDRVRSATGVEIPPDDLLKKDLVASAFSSIGVRLPKTPTGQPRIDAEVLASIDHDVAAWVLRAKKFHKMRTDFAGSIRRHMVDGRVHSTFRQVKGSVEGGDDEKGAAYGRFSSTDPNLQQQYSPEKEPEISAMWRQIFLPDDGALWAACDYSAQEPRMTVHYAYLTKCKGAEALVAKYLEDPRLDLHQETARLCGPSFDSLGIPRDKHRKNSKAIFLGLCYGMGGAKLCDGLGLPTDWWEAPDGKKWRVAGPAGRRVLEGFDRMVPFVKELAERCRKKGGRAGFVRTLSGRKCRFPVDQLKSRPGKVVFDFTHKALNRVIQGGSGDQGKLALVEADRQGIYVQIPVHDELCGSVSCPGQAKTLAQIMEEAVVLTVPTVVDIAVGPSWGDAV